MTAIAERYVSIIVNPDNQFDLVNSDLGRRYMARFGARMNGDEAAYHAARMVARRIDEALDLVESYAPTAFTRALDEACIKCDVPLLGLHVSYGTYAPAAEHVVATWHYNQLLGEWTCITF